MPKKGRRGTALYVALLLVTLVVASAYKFRANGLIACDASGYGADSYVGYCDGSAYGDYDYGAFWFGLEPTANTAAANADVLFVGNSRAQFGLSTNVVSRWFESRATRYYLLGFAYYGNMAFAGPLLDKLKPKAKAYVISVDQFFQKIPTPPAREVMSDSTGVVLSKYREKRLWQVVHRALCTRLAMLCQHKSTYFRARTNGAWVHAGGNLKSEPVAYSDSVDHVNFESEVALGRDFIAHLPISDDCILLTIVPKAAGETGTSLGTAKALATALGLPFVSPTIAGLTTFDGSHLDSKSAELWSDAFMESAGPMIQSCLSKAQR